MTSISTLYLISFLFDFESFLSKPDDERNILNVRFLNQTIFFFTISSIQICEPVDAAFFKGKMFRNLKTKTLEQARVN